MEIKPDNNLVWAILSTLFCCLPTGIYAIVKAAEVDSKWNSGDKSGAIKSADQAKKWSIYGAIGGGIMLVIYIISMLVIGFGAAITE